MQWSVCVRQVQQLCPFGNLGLTQNPCNWVLYYRDDPLDPWRFGHSPKFLAIGSHSTEMIPLIQWPWITAESNATTQSFRESCRTKSPSICFVSMTYRCLGCLVLGCLIVFGSKMEQAVHAGPYERKHIKAIGLISSVIWVVHFILFYSILSFH